jgi:hypothetical protein
MQTVIDLALAHGWTDEAVAELERHLRNKNMAAALTLVRAQDMPDPDRQRLMAHIVLAIVS